MGKKKKASGAAAAAPVSNEATSGTDPSAAPTAARTAAVPSAAPSAPVPQPWASNYEAMKIVPIPAHIDPNLFRATDSLCDKVNRAAFSDSNKPAASASVAASSSPSAAAAPASRRWLFGIYNSNADAAGRRALALEAIPEGTLLLRERGQPWLTHAEHADKVCHECAHTLYDPSIPTPPQPAAGQPRPPSRHLHCTTCEEAFYCSAACQAAHLPQHERECAALSQAEELGEVGQCSVDLVRAAIKYAVAKAREKEENGAKVKEITSAESAAEVAGLSDPYQFQSTLADSDLLLDHVSELNEVSLRNMRALGGLVLRALPSSVSSVVTADDLVSFLGRVNSNCHGLHLEAHPTIQFGFGLFPLCAIFNHSCYPNSIFVNEGASLTFRTIRPVERNEELTVNYISLYAPRTVRRKELWTEKKFFCMCRRCMLKPKNEEERERFKMDAFIGGVACQNPAVAASSSSAAASKKQHDGGIVSTPAVNAAAGKCGGCYRINYLPRDPKAEAEKSRKRREARAKRKAAAAAAAAAAAPATAASAESNEAKEDGATAPTASSSSASSVSAPPAAAVDPDLSSDSEDDDAADSAGTGDDFPLLLRPKVTSARCDVCKHSGNVDALWAIQQRALDGSEQLLANYGTG
jgi:hypothetical protein